LFFSSIKTIFEMPKYAKIGKNPARLNRRSRQIALTNRTWATKRVPIPSSRKEPITPQAIVIATGSVDPDERKNRTRACQQFTSNKSIADNIHAPLGASEASSSILTGELVFKIAGANEVRHTTNLDSELKVTSNVGGLLKKYNLAFVGIAQITKTMGGKDSKDPLMSIITQGNIYLFF
jgi:hypothetical protein